MTTTEPSHEVEQRRAPKAALSRAGLRRALQLLRDEGVRSLGTKALGHLVYRRVVVVEADLADEPPEVECEYDLDVRQLGRDELDSYVAFFPDADEATALRRMLSGSDVYVAELDGRVVSAGWVDRNVAHFDAVGAEVPIGPTTIYVRGSYTLPELRSRNIATVTYVRAIGLLRERGFERAVGFVLPENRRGFGPVVKSGAKPIGSLGWFGLGPVRVYFFRKDGGRLRLLPRLFRKRRPVRLNVDLG